MTTLTRGDLSVIFGLPAATAALLALHRGCGSYPILCTPIDALAIYALAAVLAHRAWTKKDAPATATGATA